MPLGIPIQNDAYPRQKLQPWRKLQRNTWKEPANIATSHSLLLLRAKREERLVVVGANERQLRSKAMETTPDITGNCRRFIWAQNYPAGLRFRPVGLRFRPQGLRFWVFANSFSTHPQTPFI